MGAQKSCLNEQPQRMFKLISKQIMTILVSNSLLNSTFAVDRLLTMNLANKTSVLRNKKGASSEALSLYSLKDHAQQVSFCQLKVLLY